MSDDYNAPSSTPPSPPQGPNPTEQAPWSGPSTGPTPPPPLSASDKAGGFPSFESTAPKQSKSLSIDNPLGLALGIVAVVGMLLGLFIESELIKLWDTMGWTWGVLAILAAATAVLPVLKGVVPLSDEQSGMIAKIACGYLVLWWVLFVLPYIQLNTAFLVTIAVLCALGASREALDPTGSQNAE